MAYQYNKATYELDLPIIGKQKVTVPIEKIAVDMLSQVHKHIPYYVNTLAPQVVPNLTSQAYQSAKPFLDMELENVKSHAKNLVQTEVNPKVNQVIFIAGGLSLAILGSLAYIMYKDKKR